MSAAQGKGRAGLADAPARAPWFPAFEELVGAARAYREMPPLVALGGGHYETDEVSCACGFVSQAADYETARSSLARHIKSKITAGIRANEQIVARFDAALARASEAVDSQAKATE